MKNLPKVLFLVAVSWLVGCASTGSSSIPSGAVAVHSNGVGVTLEQAQDNALRNAVQNATGALIVTERRIEDDKLSQSDISYSKGMVEHFKLINVSRNPKDKLYYINAEVIVSTAKFYSRILSSQSNVDVNGSQISKGLAQAKEQVKSQEIRQKRSEQLLMYVMKNMPNSIDSNVKKVEILKSGRDVDAVVQVDTWLNVPSVTSLCKAVNLYSEDLAALAISTPQQYDANAAAGAINSAISGLFSSNAVSGAKSRTNSSEANLIINAPMTGCFLAGGSGYYKVPNSFLSQLSADRQNLGICLTFVNADGYSLFKRFYPVNVLDGDLPIDFSWGGKVEFKALNPLFSEYSTSTVFSSRLSIADIPDQVLRSTKEFHSKVTKVHGCR